MILKKNKEKKCYGSCAPKDSTTGRMVSHLRWHHGFLSESNAWKMYEDLSSLKEKILKKQFFDSFNEDFEFDYLQQIATRVNRLCSYG